MRYEDGWEEYISGHLEALGVIFADVLVLFSGLDLVHRLTADVTYGYFTILRERPQEGKVEKEGEKDEEGGETSDRIWSKNCVGISLSKREGMQRIL